MNQRIAIDVKQVDGFNQLHLNITQSDALDSIGIFHISLDAEGLALFHVYGLGGNVYGRVLIVYRVEIRIAALLETCSSQCEKNPDGHFPLSFCFVHNCFVSMIG